MNHSSAAAPLSEARLFLRREMTEPETLHLANGEVVVFTTPRRPGASPNEDAAGVVPIDEHRSVLVLADGMGGAAGGDRAANLAVSRTVEHLLDAGDGQRAVRNAILDGVEDADRAIRELDVGAGTTLLAIELLEGNFRSYHAGDSMAALFDSEGRARWRTPPHSPVGYAVEAGLLDEFQAMTHNARHLLSNALGKRSMHVDVSSIRPLMGGDTLILGSDGLFDNLMLPEIGATLRDGDLGAAITKMVGTATRRMIGSNESNLSKPDDLTVIGFRAQPPEALGTIDFAPVESA